MAEMAKVFKNNINCDIYIGKNAGKKINDEFNSVKKELKVVSPFMSYKLANLILEKLEKSIKVTLVVNDDERLNPFLEKIIKCDPKIDVNAKKSFDELKGQVQILSLLKKIIIILTAFSIFYSNFFSFLISILFFKISPNFSFRTVILPLGVIFIFILNYIIKRKKNTAKGIKIMRHTYDYIDNLRLIVLKYNNKNEACNDYINLHSKIFIIDDETAYLGSLNFTDFGFEYNTETRVKTTDKELIKWLNNHISSIFDGNFKSLSIIELANKVHEKNCYSKI